MKKTIIKVVSLVLVVGMLFAFTSCTQEVLVRFVDQNGNDVDISGLMGGTGTPAATQPAATEPAATQPAATEPAATEAGATQPAATEAGATQPAATQPAATQPAASTGNKVPSTKEEIFNFYKAAVAKIKNNGEAGYTKKEWQVLDEINIGPALVNNAVKGAAGNFMTTEDAAEDQVCDKGSDKAKDRFPNCTLTDMSKVASATLEQANGNYKIKIVMADEDTPKKSGSFLGQVTNSILYWEDIDNTLKTDATVSKILSEYSDIHINYQGFLIEAEITPEGKFVSLSHTATANILIGHAKILVVSIDNKTGKLVNYCKYTGFAY